MNSSKLNNRTSSVQYHLHIRRCGAGAGGGGVEVGGGGGGGGGGGERLPRAEDARPGPVHERPPLRLPLPAPRRRQPLDAGAGRARAAARLRRAADQPAGARADDHPTLHAPRHVPCSGE